MEIRVFTLIFKPNVIRINSLEKYGCGGGSLVFSAKPAKRARCGQSDAPAMLFRQVRGKPNQKRPA